MTRTIMQKRGIQTPLANVLAKIVHMSSGSSANDTQAGKRSESEVLRMSFLNDTRPLMDIWNNSSSSEVLQNDTVTSDTLRDDPGQYLGPAGTFADSEKELPPFLVPKFIQALVTLLLCAILISTTLCIITQLKKLCLIKHKNNSVNDVEAIGGNSGTNPNSNSENNVNPTPAAVAAPTASVILEEANVTDDELINEQTSALNPAKQKPVMNPVSGSSRQKRSSRRASGRQGQVNAVYLKVPGIQFVRRTSGPFGDETMAFVRETYRKPVKPPASPELGFTGLPRANHHYN